MRGPCRGDRRIERQVYERTGITDRLSADFAEATLSFLRQFRFVVMPKTFMVKKHRRFTPTTVFASGEKMTSRRIWSPWCDKPNNSFSGHLAEETGSTLVTDVTSSRRCVTSFPVTDRQFNALWSPSYAEVGELLLFYCHDAC